MITFRQLLLSAGAVLAGSALFAVAVSGQEARPPAPTLTSPTSPEKAPDADGFIQRWLLLEPIPFNELTESAVRAGASRRTTFRTSSA